MALAVTLALTTTVALGLSSMLLIFIGVGASIFCPTLSGVELAKFTDSTALLGLETLEHAHSHTKGMTYLYILNVVFYSFLLIHMRSHNNFKQDNHKDQASRNR